MICLIPLEGEGNEGDVGRETAMPGRGLVINKQGFHCPDESFIFGGGRVGNVKEIREMPSEREAKVFPEEAFKQTFSGPGDSLGLRELWQ